MLTPEQKERIDANRLRALSIRAKKLEAERHNSITAHCSNQMARVTPYKIKKEEPEEITIYDDDDRNAAEEETLALIENSNDSGINANDSDQEMRDSDDDIIELVDLTEELENTPENSGRIEPVTDVRLDTKGGRRRILSDSDEENDSNQEDIPHAKAPGSVQRNRSMIESDDESDGHQSPLINDCEIVDDEVPGTSSEVRRRLDFGNREESGNKSSSEDSDSTSDFVTSAEDTSYESADSFKSPDPYMVHLKIELSNKQKGNKRKKKPKKKVAKKKKLNNGESIGESDEDEDDDDSTDGDSFAYKGDTSQEVSIFKILIGKVLKDNKDIQKFSGIEQMQKVIKSIVESYNCRGSSKFIEEEVTTPPEVNEADKKYFKGDEFQVRVFIRTTNTKIGLLNGLGINQGSNNIHILVFYYRKGEIFALATNRAYNALLKFADVNFPKKIAARLLSEEGKIETTERGLFGNQRLTKKIMKEHEECNPYSTIQLCEEFTAALRDTASIKALSVFQSKKFKSGKGKKLANDLMVKITIGITRIRIRKRYTHPEFLSILEHFSIIDKGEKTYQVGNNCHPTEDEEQDTDKHNQFLNPVTKDQEKELNLQFSKYISDAMREVKNEKMWTKLQNFELCYKHPEDFSNGIDFYVRFKQNVFVRYARAPSLRKLLTDLANKSDILKDFQKDHAPAPRREQQAREELLGQKFLRKLDQVTLSYRISGTKENTFTPSDKIINFIEGHMLGHDYDIYWRVRTLWCSVREDYVQLNQQQFIHVLKENLDNNMMQLNHYWDDPDEAEDAVSIQELSSSQESGSDAIAPGNLRKLEASYIDLYNRETDYVVWKEKDGKNDKLFDMLRIEENGRLTVFYVSGDFTSRKGHKISNSILVIRNIKIRGGSPSKDAKTEILRKFYKDNKTDLNRMFKLRKQADGFKTLLEKLYEATIVLAIAKSKTGASLIVEKDLDERITLPTIVSFLNMDKNGYLTNSSDKATYIDDDEEVNWDELSKSIQKELQQDGYLDVYEAVSSKLLVCSENRFSLPTSVLLARNDTLKKAVFCKSHQTKTNSI